MNETQSTTKMADHNIVILGGNFAGVGAAHYILRHVFPALGSLNSTYQIILISPSERTFYKIAAPRNITEPSTELFFSINDAFAKYGSSHFQFIQGTAMGLDTAAREIDIMQSGKALRKIQYDYLIIATGTTSQSPLWTLQSDHALTKTSIDEVHHKLQKADSVIIAGGGAVGVETAGEIAHYFSVSSCKLYSGSARLLPRLKSQRIGAEAQSKLEKMGVHVIHDQKVVYAQRAEHGTTSVKFDNGAVEEVDVFIDATGGKPNSQFLPKEWLDDRGYVLTEMSSMKVKKAPARVYSIGDVASYSNQSLLDVVNAIPALGYSVWFDLHSATNGPDAKSLKPKKYAQVQSDMQIVPIGPTGGVGVLFGFQVPNWLVRLVKSRTFLVQKAPGLATGADYEKP